MQSMGKGWDVTGRVDLSVILSAIFIKCSLCRTLLQIGYGDRVVRKLCRRGSLCPKGPKSVSGTRFSVCWWYCGSREYPHTHTLVLLPEGWRPVARQPFKSFLSPSLFNSRMSMPGCLAGCLGSSVERPGHLSKSWAPVTSPAYRLGLCFALRKGRKISCLS